MQQCVCSSVVCSIAAPLFRMLLEKVVATHASEGQQLPHSGRQLQRHGDVVQQADSEDFAQNHVARQLPGCGVGWVGEAMAAALAQGDGDG